MTESYRIITEDGDYLTTEGGDRLITEGTGVSSTVARRKARYNFWKKYEYFYIMKPSAKKRRRKA